MVGREEDALERQQDELTVLEAMYGGDDFELEDGKAVFLVRSAAASLTVRLPPLYPYEPPMLELSCPVASPAAVEAADQELTAIVRGDEEQECCVQLVQRFLELAAEELVEVQADAAAAAAATWQARCCTTTLGGVCTASFWCSRAARVRAPRSSTGYGLSWSIAMPRAGGAGSASLPCFAGAPRARTRRTRSRPSG